MGYMKKGGTVCNPAKKSLTVFQNSYQETYTYQSGTVPVYGDPPIIRYDEQTVAVGRASAHFVQTNINGMTLQGTGGPYQSGDWYSGNAVVETSETRPYQGTVTSRQTVGLGWSCGKEKYPTVISSNVTLYRTQRTPVYGDRPIIRYDPVMSQGTREAWNTRWSKLSA